MSRLKPHLTYANVMSSIAVFAALTGGVAWAHGKIGTQDLRNGAVTTPKLAGGAVTAPKLRDNAVRTAKLANGAVTAGKVGNVVVREQTNPGLPGIGAASASCEPGELRLSGGVDWTGDEPGPDQGVPTSYPDPLNDRTWTVSYFNSASEAMEFRVLVACLQP